MWPFTEKACQRGSMSCSALRASSLQGRSSTMCTTLQPFGLCPGWPQTMILLSPQGPFRKCTHQEKQSKISTIPLFKYTCSASLYIPCTWSWDTSKLRSSSPGMVMHAYNPSTREAGRSCLGGIARHHLKINMFLLSSCTLTALTASKSASAPVEMPPCRSVVASWINRDT
jgi:hypothetical protein